MGASQIDTEIRSSGETTFCTSPLQSPYSSVTREYAHVGLSDCDPQNQQFSLWRLYVYDAATSKVYSLHTIQLFLISCEHLPLCIIWLLGHNVLSVDDLIHVLHQYGDNKKRSYSECRPFVPSGHTTRHACGAVLRHGVRAQLPPLQTLDRHQHLHHPVLVNQLLIRATK